MDAMTSKIEVQQFLYACFLTFNQNNKFALKKNILKFHLQGSRGQKVAEKSRFFKGLILDPYRKKLKMRCQFFLLFLPGCLQARGGAVRGGGLLLIGYLKKGQMLKINKLITFFLTYFSSTCCQLSEQYLYQWSPLLHFIIGNFKFFILLFVQFELK